MARKHRGRRSGHSKKVAGVEHDLADMKITDTASQNDTAGRVGAPEATKDSDTGANEDKPFRLLALPDELIVRIVEYAVVMSSHKHPIKIRAINIDEPHFWWAYPTLGVRIDPEKSKDLLQPPVTRICRLLRDEGLKAFYEQNHFLDRIKGITNLFVEWDPRDGDFDKEMAWLRIVEAKVSLKTKTFVRLVKAPKGKKPRYQVAYGQPKKGGYAEKGAGQWIEVVKNKK
ncbi:hypothetical protein CB0940_06357 [Cercospora beticola]|uniref:Uncharacterized protein n=1 Tax=Cercospora beticola TaxID=122368 RepID=A0A2G5I034_CERBT|nr:hypothetical protein CB0940_06357 [Cercospora beticola]PIA98149.1 hypothetical protein CB0940_06357 [Cercospora beticola]WPA98985.1 hypothetical protein RHO25_003598 [Cercospora beticola]